MLIIATTGRCGTWAIARGLTRFSHTTVDHEPSPQLLREAFLKHVGADHRTDLLAARLEWLRAHEGRSYGETFRATPLLDDLLGALPTARFLLLVREPYSYVRSAMTRRVLLRGDAWDIYRVLPLEIDLSELSRAEVIALHWREVNRYLLDFQSRHPQRSRIMVLGDLRSQVFEIADYGGARITDHSGLVEFLGRRPNRAPLRDVLRGLRDGDAARVMARAKLPGRDRVGDRAEMVRHEDVRVTVEQTWQAVLAASRQDSRL